MEKGRLIGKGRTAEIFAWGEDGILKLFHEGQERDDVEYEARISRAVQASGARAPALLDSVEIEGRLGLVYTRIYGPSLASLLQSKPWQAPRLAHIFARLHASVHRRTAPDLPAQCRRLELKMAAAYALPDHLRIAAIQSLQRLPDGDTLCHGDFHPENVIMSSRGPVVIDWVDATRGNPLADVARTSIILNAARLHLPVGVPLVAGRILISIFHKLYVFYYTRATHTSREVIEAWRGAVAAARLSEEVAVEEAWLIETVAASLRRPRE